MSATVRVSRFQPVFREDVTKAPGHPVGARILVKPKPVASTTEGGIHLADEGQKRANMGRIIACGDEAADEMYDRGINLGDEIAYAQYAGVIEDWQHIVRRGEGKKCKHDGAWDGVPKGNVLNSERDPRWSAYGEPDTDTHMHACRTCGALRVTERTLVMAVGDILFDTDLQARLEAGEVRRVRGVTGEDKRTRHFIERMTECPEPFETEGSK